MVVKIKSAPAIARKWAQVTPARSTVWQAEIAAASDSDWAEPTKAAEPIYGTGVQAAIGAGLYGKGVEAHRGKWKRKALAVGPGRYGPGVTAAEADQAAGYAPYREVIAGLDLPPKGPRGAEGNYERVRAVGSALHNKRVGG